MTLIVFIFLIFAVFCLYQIFAIILNIREIRRLRDIKYRSCTQHSFGVARQNLMVLAAEGEIPSDSITFLFFYITNTKVMRHPDKYKELSRMLQESFLDDTHNSNANRIADMLDTESKHWSESVKKGLVQQNISALNSLMVLHSPVLRTIITVAKVSLPIIKRKIRRDVGVFNFTSRVIAKGDPEMRTFVNTKNELEHLAGFA